MVGADLGPEPRSVGQPGSAQHGGRAEAEAETEAERSGSPCGRLCRAATAAMAGSEPRGAGSPPPASDWSRLEAAILSGWRTFWHSVGKERAARTASREEEKEETSALRRLPVSQPRPQAAQRGRPAATSGCVPAWRDRSQSRRDVDAWWPRTRKGRPTAHTSDHRLPVVQIGLSGHLVKESIPLSLFCKSHLQAQDQYIPVRG